MSPTHALILLAGLSLLATPSATALAHAEDPQAGPNQYRFILDEGPLEARALNGTPNLNHDPLPEATTTPNVLVEPWRGYPRTVLLTLTGPGQAYLADNASGLILNLQAPPATDEQNPTPDEDAPPPGQEDATNPDTATADDPETPTPNEDPGEATVLGPTPWDDPPATNASPADANLQPSGPSPSEETGRSTTVWMLIGGLLLVSFLVVSRKQLQAGLQHVRATLAPSKDPHNAPNPEREDVPVVYQSQAERLRGHQPPRRDPPTPTQEANPPKPP